MTCCAGCLWPDFVSFYRPKQHLLDGQNRGMSKDYERLTATSEVFVYVAMIRLMLKRLARA
jgi:hypothetical protein